MASHVRFVNNSDEEDDTTPGHVEQHQLKPQLPSIKTIHKKNQKAPPSSSKRKSRSKLPANQIRSIERYLKHKEHELPPGIFQEKKRELEEWKRIRAERERRARERKFDTRYRRIKFFESKKVQRILDNIAKKGNKQEDQEAKLQAQRDLQYIQRYPKDRKYVALFPSGGHTEQTKKHVEQMRAIIERLDTASENPTTSIAENAADDDFFMANDSENE